MDFATFATFAALAAAFIAAELAALYAARRDLDWAPYCHVAGVTVAAAMSAWLLLAGELLVAVVVAVVLVPLTVRNYRTARLDVAERQRQSADLPH